MKVFITQFGNCFETFNAISLRVCQFLVAVFSIACFAVVGRADGLPKAEDGYLYYCAGVKRDNYFQRPNAFIAFKLRKDEVRTGKKEAVRCFSDQIGEQFVLKRFLAPNDDLLRGFINFKLPIKLRDTSYKLGVLSGGSDSYLTEKRLGRFDDRKSSCGAEDGPDENGLIPIKRQGPVHCRMASYQAFAPKTEFHPSTEVNCWGKSCLINFFYLDWLFSIRFVPEELVSDWRYLVQKAIEAINVRIVFYIAPNRCIGPLDCRGIGRILNIPQN